MGSAKERLMPGNHAPSLGLSFSTYGGNTPDSNIPQSLQCRAPDQSFCPLLWVSLEKGLLSVFWTGLALGMTRTEFFKIQVKVADALGKQKPCVCRTVFQG